jgi:mono/diheme cytochrome c family protein
VGGHKGPDLSGVGRKKSKAEMRQQIVFGSKVMPAFGDDLEPDELKDLIAYLKSCRQKPAPTPPTSNSN